LHLKDRQRRHWDAVAQGWGTWLEWTEENFQPLTSWLQQAADWTPGSRVLDAGCGSGYPAFEAARAVQPDGQVVAIDLASDMIAVAAERARARRVDNIEFLEMDAEHLAFDEASFDSVITTYGLMFCPDPAQALTEGHRVLVEGGRLAVVTWDEARKSPFFTVIRDVAAAFFAFPEPSPDEPHPFRLSSAEALAALMSRAGFSNVRIESLPMTFVCQSASEYLQLFSDLAWKAKVLTLPPADMERFQRSLERAVEPYADGDGLRLVATSLCAIGVK
jgi:enediyne biosynthesis protein CalE5